MNERYKFSVEAEDLGAASRGVTELADILREANGVLEVGRDKANDQTMDLGMIVSVVATSGATLAIARGLAAWLRARRGVTLTIEMDGRSGNLKAAVAGLDPEAAVRIVEMIRKN
jgi:hypothetical protein